MDTMETDRLVEDYLRRLDQAAAHMQRARRAELVAEIRGHIETALHEEHAAGEAAVRNVLDRLGPPEEIVEAAEPVPPPAVKRVGVLEIAALIALIVPFLGWLVGLVLVVVSGAWSRRDKIIGALLLVVPIVLLSLGLVASGPSGTDESLPPGDPGAVGEREDEPLGPGGIELVRFVAGLPSALYLGLQLRRDATTGRTGSAR